jgi:hypothetical protein
MQRLDAVGTTWSWAFGLIIPLTVVCLMLLISRRSDRNESMEPERSIGSPSPDRPEPELPSIDPTSRFYLGQRDVWTSGRHSIHQRGVHARIALCVTGVIAAWPLTNGTFLRTALIVVAGAAIVCDVVLLLWGRDAFGDRKESQGRPHSLHDSTKALVSVKQMTPGMVLHCTGWVMVIGLGLVTALAVLSGSSLPPDDQLTSWFDNIVVWGFRVQIGLLLIVVIAVGAACWVTPRRKRLFIRGWGSAILASTAVLLGAVLTSAVMIAVPAWLATPGLAIGPSSLATAMNEKASWYGASIGAAGFAVAIVTLIVVVVLFGCVLLTMVSVWLPGSAGSSTDRRHVIESYRAYFARRREQMDIKSTPPSSGRFGKGQWHWSDGLTQGRMSEVAKIFWWARRVDYIPATVAVVSVGCMGVLGYVMWRHWINPDYFAWQVGTDMPSKFLPHEVVVVAASWGIWLSVCGLLTLFAISLLATRDSSLRRHIAIIWDVASFWPRDTHPLAPPCYGERAIPQLVCRINWAVGWNPKDQSDIAPPGRVILAGHSQGSVIAAAAIMKLQPAARDRVALLTYGSVLSRLYSRFFPSYFGIEELAKLAESLTVHTPEAVESQTGSRAVGAERTRWGNLYRYSDFIGGPIMLELQADAKELSKQKRTEAHTDSNSASVHSRNPSSSIAPALNGIDALRPDPAFWAEPGDSIPPTADRHSRFDADPSFQNEISRLIQMFGLPFNDFDPGPASPQVWGYR